MDHTTLNMNNELVSQKIVAGICWYYTASYLSDRVQEHRI